MNNLVVSGLSLLLSVSGLAQSRNCLRMMPVDELTRAAVLIARVKVLRSGKANYRGNFSQIATLRPVDVIEGDFTLKQVSVFARSNVRCAEDNYSEGQEMLVFLEPEDSLYRTLNFQYGQFLIVGEVVKGWRDKSNKPIDKPYPEVRQEIERYVNGASTQQEVIPPRLATPGPPDKPSLAKPPAQPAPRP